MPVCLPVMTQMYHRSTFSVKSFNYTFTVKKKDRKFSWQTQWSNPVAQCHCPFSCAGFLILNCLVWRVMLVSARNPAGGYAVCQMISVFTLLKASNS